MREGKDGIKKPSLISGNTIVPKLNILNKKFHAKFSFGLSLMKVFIEHDWFWPLFIKAYLRHTVMLRTIKYAIRRCSVEEKTVLVKPGILESLPKKP